MTDDPRAGEHNVPAAVERRAGAAVLARHTSAVPTSATAQDARVEQDQFEKRSERLDVRMGDLGEWLSGWNLLVSWLVFLPVAVAVSVVVVAGQWFIDRVRGRRRTRHTHD